MLDTTLAMPSMYPTAASMLQFPAFFFASHKGSGNFQALYPDELALLKGAGEKRRSDFCAGRYCAHRALDELGYPGLPVLMDENGAPVWPDNVVGSISHSGDMAIAVAASFNRIRAVGVDIQARNKPFPASVIPSYFHRQEIHHLLRSQPGLVDLYIYAVFSAKESVLKCCYIAFGCLLEFADILIAMNLAEGCFYASTPHHPKCGQFYNEPGVMGRIGFDRYYVFTSVWLAGE